MEGHGDTEPSNTCALSDLPVIYASARYANKYLEQDLPLLVIVMQTETRIQERWPEGSASTIRLSGMTPDHLFVLPFLELRQSSSSLHPWPCPERASRPSFPT